MIVKATGPSSSRLGAIGLLAELATVNGGIGAVFT